MIYFENEYHKILIIDTKKSARKNHVEKRAILLKIRIQDKTQISSKRILNL